MEKAIDKDACLAKGAVICLDTSIAEALRQPITPALLNTPFGYSALAAEECGLCGGESRPFFSWTPGVWKPAGEWADFQWLQRNVTRPFRWDRVFSFAKFDSLLGGARAMRVASIVKNELSCSFGYKFDAIQALGCSCSDEGTCGENEVDVSAVRSTITGSATLCAGVPGNVTLSRVRFEVPVRECFLMICR